MHSLFIQIYFVFKLGFISIMIKPNFITKAIMIKLILIISMLMAIHLMIIKWVFISKFTVINIPFSKLLMVFISRFTVIDIPFNKLLSIKDELLNIGLFHSHHIDYFSSSRSFQAIYLWPSFIPLNYYYFYK